MGVHVAAIRRPLPTDEAELMEDLKPFFHVISLFQYAGRTGIAPFCKGHLFSVQAPTINSIALTFRPRDASPVALHLTNVRSTVLTIWRVDDVLDALQVFISTDDTAVYLQTGGEALLNALADCEPVSSSTAPKAAALFNEPIISLRDYGSRVRLP
jgi:hypothetical protein